MNAATHCFQTESQKTPKTDLPEAPHEKGDFFDVLTPAQAEVADRLYEWAANPSARPGVACLGGFAGVGKTYLVSRLLKALKGRYPILVTAPTHKALAVLADKLGDVGDLRTIQGALGLRMQELEDGRQLLKKEKEPCLRDYGLCVVDEASMIGADLFAVTIGQRDRCKVLFVGDPAQLSPVGEDIPSLAFDAKYVPLQARLTEVVRQACDHPAIRFSVALRGFIAEKRGPDLASLAQLLQPGDEKHLAIVPGGAHTLRSFAIDAVQRGLDTRILAFTNRAVKAHNASIHEALYPGVPGFAVGEQVIAHEGFSLRTPIGITLPVRTSQVLKVLSKTDALHPRYTDVPCWLMRLELEDGRAGEAFVPQDRVQLDIHLSDLWRQWRALKAQAQSAECFTDRKALSQQAKRISDQAWALRNEMPHLRHAYAMTIHKSQGSTFETALVDWTTLPDKAGEDASRLAYVAITRPSLYAVIVTC